MLPLLINFLLAIHILVSLLIIFIVLMQRPKSEGLGAAFGGGMTENLFGAQTSNVLANFTRWLGGIFFVLTLALSILYAKQSTQHSAIQAAAIKAAAAKAANSPVSVMSGTTGLSGTAALGGTDAPFSNSELNVSGRSTPPPVSLLPAATPGNTLIPVPSLKPTATPAASPVSSGTVSGH